MGCDVGRNIREDRTVLQILAAAVASVAKQIDGQGDRGMACTADGADEGNRVGEQLLICHMFIGKLVDEAAIGTVFQQTPHQICEQILMAANRRVDAAMIALIVHEVFVKAVPHAVEALELKIPRLACPFEDGRDRQGVVRGKGQIKVGKELAINPGQVYGPLEGEATKEPAFGLEAVWIDPSQRDMARTLGYTVVDASTAIATHLNKVLRDNAADLLSHDEVQQLLDKLAAKSPKLVEDLVPGKLSLGVVTRTLQNLLNESVSIRDMRTIAETLSEVASRTQEPDQLTSLVRPKLGRMIVQSLVDDSNALSVMTLDPNLEQLLHNVLQQTAPGQSMALEPGLSERLFAALREGARAVEEMGHPAVLVVSPAIRPWMSKAVRYRVNEMTLLSYSEIPDDQSVKVVHTVHAETR